MTTSEPLEGAALDAAVKRNAIVLTAATAFGGSMMPIAVAFGGLAGVYLLGPDKSLATVPVTALTLGSAVATIPAAILMARIGRRAGLVLGAVPGILGGVLTALAIVAGSFWLFAAASILIGASAAFGQQYRFAAVDAGTEMARSRALGLVMAGGILAAVIGPQAAILTRDLFSPIPFAGAYASIAVLAVVGALIVSRVRDLVPPRPRGSSHDRGRPLLVIMRQPRFIAAVLCGMASYAMMSLVMTAAPIAMVGCGLTQDDAALGIQWHVLAMFAPSYFTGRLIERFGKNAIVIAGLLILCACSVVAIAGITLAHFWIALVLLGIGWNFGFVGATAMLTETYRPEERGRVQGLNDFLIFAMSALASFFAGVLIGGPGWIAVNSIVFPTVALALAALALASLARGTIARPSP
ncbi:MFS transporter [Kaistia geumhonensis]|uniref:MFS family permease n=1 Tax=Kaistia geumhonensis TaxID=410839 RepID=A0ABU0M0H7_9HYPH|nr:MFS transporter [Kaistia geumhonensis]MCX5480310.1 MFS transporter [Kaistia geumhonensis]MDQ0514457.1 MFS family permease [Kaistia geumhonensis]